MAPEVKGLVPMHFRVLCEPEAPSRTAIKSAERPPRAPADRGRALAQQLPHHERQIESAPRESGHA
jgi:hypothetical protein